MEFKEKGCGSSFDVATFLSEPLFPVRLVQNSGLLLSAISEKNCILVLFLNQERGEEVLPRLSVAILHSLSTTVESGLESSVTSTGEMENSLPGTQSTGSYRINPH